MFSSDRGHEKNIVIEYKIPVNAFSVDVEDGHSAFMTYWLHIDTEPSDIVERETQRFLETFAQYGVKATFFILGEVAKKFPALVKKIAKDGHEIGIHGFYHVEVFKLTEQEFRSAIADSKKMLEDITSGPVFGHRAPAFSIMPQTKWALEILAQEGFKYDSSIYPITGRRYGWPGFSKHICKVDLPSGLGIIEVPMSTVTIMGKVLPAAGGGYIRHFPYIVTRWAIKHIQKTRPAVVYMHPYEINTDPWSFPTEHLPPKERKSVIRFYNMQLRNRNTVLKKMHNLLSEFQFTTINQVIEKTVTDSNHQLNRVKV